MNNTLRLNVLKNIIYVVTLILLYVLGTVPGLFVFHGVKPVWVIPAAVAVAMFEGEFSGGIYGALAGLLCDSGGFLLFGFNGFITAFCCIIAGLLVAHLMRCNLLTCLLFAFVTLLIRGSLEYFFSYGMWNYTGVRLIYMTSTLPAAIYSALTAIPGYYLIRGISRRFRAIKEDSL